MGGRRGPATSRESLLHGVFERQARSTPDRVAVIDHGRTCTYEQLDARAGRLARRLVALGAAPEGVVASLVPRSLESVVALLAVLESGAAFLPLDEQAPPDRLAFVLADAGVELVLVPGSGDVPEAVRAAARPVEVDSSPGTESDGASPSPPLPLNVAYLVYTSGSTGNPKGVAVPHAAAAARFAGLRSVLPLTPRDRVAHLASPSFDASLHEVFWALSGATLVVASPADVAGVTPLLELIASERVTCVSLVPTMLRILLAAAGPVRLESVRHVVCGGEALSSELAREARARMPAAAVHNVYGPTETAITVTCWTWRERDDGAVPLGAPHPGTVLAVHSDDLRPAAGGEAGELYVSGPQLARGYVGRADLTAERFLPDPAGPAGSRTYRTGDLVRRRADGGLEFAGRVDGQVKVRGYRVELQEVEACLLRHPRVRQAAVVARADAGGVLDLVAYVAPLTRADVPPLRSFVAERLPAYMVPSRIRAVPALPLTAGGKVDRARLPDEPEPAAGATETVRVPGMLLEHRLASIWADVLGRREVGVDENFFEIGGHSLLAVRLVARIRDGIGLDVPARALLEAPTVAALVAWLAADRRERGLLELQGGAGSRPMLCVPGAGGTGFVFRELASALGEDVGVVAVEAPGAREGEVPLDGIDGLAEHYVGLVRGLQPAGPYTLLGFSMGGHAAMEMAGRLLGAGEEVDLVVLVDAVLPGTDPEADRLLRLTIDRAAIREELLRGELGERAGEATFAADLERYVNLYLASQRAALRHVPRPVPVPALLVQATANRAAEEMERTATVWSGLATGGVEIVRVPADHHGLLAPPHVAEVASAIRRLLPAEVRTPLAHPGLAPSRTVDRGGR